MSTTSQSVSAPATITEPLHDRRSFWRVLLAVIAPVPALALAVSILLSPYTLGADSSQDTATKIAAHQGAMQTGLWFTLLFSVTLVPATIALVWVCRRRTPRFTAVAGFVTLYAFSAGMALPSTELPALVGAQKGLDQATIVTLTDALSSAPTSSVAALSFLIGITIGRILLGIMLWRSRIAPRWMAVALILAAPVEFVPITGSNLQPALSWTLTAIGYAAASLALLRSGNDDFDLPPLAARTKD